MNTTMAFTYKHILMVGATSGIGHAMAERLIEAGYKVTVVGRRKERLDEFVAKYGEEKVSAIPFDIGETDKAPQFAKDVMTAHPTIDCIFLNAGVQNSHDFSRPETVNLQAFNNEMHINYTSFVALTHAFLPYLLEKKDLDTSFVFTTSNLAIVPLPGLESYCASKAALNVFLLCLRDNLGKTNIKVIELSPPPVQTELHDYLTPAKGRQIGMPLATFTTQAYEALHSGSDTVIIGAIGDEQDFDEIVARRRRQFDGFAEFVRGRMMGMGIE
ncbi:oxidoreductase short-chain dehydrogenase reductase family protein [Rutstroemia sp. NJR-2017a BVV2]|nr:oxidoreductase short-chain dehydrogenase reductase family protein [Rutstroemia sp. NJR-2017a BVV2]